MNSRWIILLGLLVLGAATAGMLAGIEPFASWYYLFAWYATIAIADAWAHARDPRRPLLLARPALLGSLLAWSAIFWFSFELWNLRLENWYYVNVSDRRALRWPGTALAFATVLPGIFAVSRLLAAHGVAKGARGAPIRITPGRLRLLAAIGLASAALVLIWPRRFFPLVWGITFFLAAPFNYRRGERGILRQLEAGEWGPALRLLGAGAFCGVLWELFNSRARAKWIYTVPGFEELKIFEMPVLGFLGFPPFALECYEMYRAVISLGLAREWEDEATIDGRAAASPSPQRPRAARALPARVKAVTAAALSGASVLTLALMDRATVDSTTPRPAHLPAVDPVLAARLAELRVGDVAELGRLLASPAGAAKLGIDEAARAELAGQAELALLCGIGSRQAAKLVAAGITSIAELARLEVGELQERLRAVAPGERLRPARLRVWVRAARAEVEARRGGAPLSGGGGALSGGGGGLSGSSCSAAAGSLSSSGALSGSSRSAAAGSLSSSGALSEPG